MGNLQFYFIFNDHTKTSEPTSKSREIFIKPQNVALRKIRIQYFCNYSAQADGTFAGVEFIDKMGEVCL